MDHKSKDNDDYVQLDLKGIPINEKDSTRTHHDMKNSIPSFTLEKLQEKLRRIKSLSWISAELMGDGSHGRTLEYHLGVPENNLSIPDLGKFELKSSLSDASTPVTLFSKVPKRIGGESLSDFIKKYGYWSDKKKCQSLNCTVSGREVNNRGWLLKVNHSSQKIYFIHQDNEVAFQDIPVLQDILSRKLSNLVLVIADRKKVSKTRFFRYSKAYLLTNADVDNFVKLLEHGDITFDWRMYIRKNGRVRDHGPVYRIKESNLPLLYEKRERLM